MILDQNAGLAAAFGGGVPTGSTNASFCGAIDLNPDFGSGASARKSPLAGLGEDWGVLVEVNTSFVVGSGTPTAQIHLLGSGANTLIANNQYVSLGCLAPSPRGTASTGAINFGFRAADLTAGTQFFLRPNGWTEAMGLYGNDTVAEGRDLRYLILAIVVPNAAAGTNFSAGVIAGWLAKGPGVHSDATDFIYPSGVLNVG